MPEQKINVSEAEMKLLLKGVGKKYGGRWIFRNLNSGFDFGNRIAVTGPNGSGKSTLLQMIAGFVSPSEGKVVIGNDHFTKSSNYCVIAAPYLDLPEELTLKELADFYFSFRKMRLPIINSLQQCNLINFLNHSIKEFSSGMKQKVKLSLTFSAEADIYIFDEPCSHLDEKAIHWYQNSFSGLPVEAIVMVGSNSVQSEISGCNHTIHLS